MASIGNIYFLAIRGRVAKPGMAVEEITRPGVDGHAFKQIGKRAAISTLITLYDGISAADAELHISYSANLKGTIVTVVYNDGTNDQNVQVLEVEPVQVKRVATAVGGLNNGNWLVTLRWTVQKTT